MDSSRDIVKKLRENRILKERKNYKEMDHKDLVKLAQDGDQLAYNTLMDEYDAAISKAASKFIFDSGDSDDAKQIASIGFWEAVQKWEGNGSFGAYANMIMNRKLTDQLRKDSANKELINSQSASLDAPAATDDEGGEMTLGSTMSDKRLSPEDEYLGRDGARKIMKFLKEELSDTERRVILKYIEGYKVSEISKEEDMKYKSVENAVKRVKDKLAEYLRNVRESRKIKLSEESIFSDEEKQILKSMLTKINDSSTVNESAADEESLYDKISDIQYEIEELISTMKETDSVDTYQDCQDKVKELHAKLVSYEDDIPEDDDELYAHYETVYSLSIKAEDTEADNIKPRDHYAEIGMSPRDF